jgi:aspartyl-tRNA(Asn)/glutamyl-tRNA(Gln) amidotransferase subunit A
MHELTHLTMHEALDLMRAGDVTSLALTEAVLERIRAVDDKVRAYLRVNEEVALVQARQADARRKAGDDALLLGIPIALKDNLSTMGVETTSGSRILKGYIPPFDATVVAKLREAGAVILGKTNLDEFAMGSSTENSGFFTTCNPWDLSRVPGGSSGGSAAAVAAGEAIAALGTDTGGSVRQPASLCGVVGLRPTYGRCSRYGLVAFASSLDQAGPLTRDVTDCALLLRVIAGADERDGTTLPNPVPDYVAALGSTGDESITYIRGLRLGVPREYLMEGLQPEIAEAIQAAVRTFVDLGAEIVEISLPHTDEALPVYYLLAPAEASANLARFDGVRYGYRASPKIADTNHPVDTHTLDEMYIKTRGQGFGAEVKRRIMLGTYALSAGYYDAYYLKAQKVRTLIKGDFDAAFETVDAIIGPTSPCTAFKIGERVDDPLQMYLADIFTLSQALAGIPAISIPCGFDAQGLPIGLQVAAPALQEARLLQIAYVYEQATTWHQHSPVLESI